MVAVIGGIVTTVIMQGVSLYREQRQHDWAREQAVRDSEQRLRVAAHGLERSAEQVDLINRKIDKNTEVSVAAFQEANNVNRKIQAIGEMRLRKDQIERP